MKNIGVLCLASVILMFGCKKSQTKREVVEKRKGLTCHVIVVHSDSVFTGPVYYGVVKPYRKIDYHSPVSGKIEYMADGVVKKGDVVINIRDSALYYEFNFVKAKLASLKPFLDRGIYKPEYYDLLAKLKKIENKLKLTNFKSPFDGFVETLYKSGDYVNKGDKVFTLYESDILKVEVPAYSRNYYRGEKVEVTLDTIKEVGFIDGFKFDKENNEIYTVVKIPDKDGIFKIGDFVKVKFIVLKGYGIKVPTKSLKKYKDRYVVFKLSGNTLIWRYIEPAFIGEDYSLIKNGLNENDTILVEGVSFASHNGSCEKIICSDTY